MVQSPSNREGQCGQSGQSRQKIKGKREREGRAGQGRLEISWLPGWTQSVKGRAPYCHVGF